MAMSDATAQRTTQLRTYLIVVLAFLIIQATVLLAMGRVPICTCGVIRFWVNDPNSAENSQQLLDWYSLTHIIHGFIFYAVTWMVLPRAPVGLRLAVAVGIEAAWEITENTSWIIDRYRAGTISLNYYGDSVLNSLSDTLAMITGFVLARALPIWTVIAAALVLELWAGYAIRDNLTLNIIMLIHPVDAIRHWQAGG
jgi:hypothetical protein